jgi:CelD/BcsL family acetyltransferase involved in cellulose biosynthesis
MLSSRVVRSRSVEPLPETAGLRVEEIEDALTLELLREPWNELCAGCLEATPFHSPEWLLPFAERFAKGGLWVLTVWRGDRLVGLAPLQIVPRPEGRTLTFLGTPMTDYHGMLVAAGPPGEGVLEALVDHVAAASARWDICALEELRADDPLLGAAFPPGFRSEVSEQEACPYVPLPSTGEQLTAEFPHELGARLARSVRGLKRAGELRFVVCGRGGARTRPPRPQDSDLFFDAETMSEAAAADALIGALFRLHAARWNARQAPGVLSGEAVQQLHREVAAGMLGRGRLRLYGLSLDGRIEAVVYAFAHGQRLYSYLGGFNPVLGKFSPGLVILWHAMLMAIEEGLDELDFLRGDEAYKYRFGARVRWNRRRLVRPA